MDNEEFFQLPNPHSIIYNFEGYTQSANALFHFMTKRIYLETALSRKALVPWYCLEDISCLGLSIDGGNFNEIAILQKCFCDIPLYKIVVNFNLQLSEIEGFELIKDNTHTGYYGEYAIAFSKAWCEDKNLQPIHYLNEKSSYAESFKKLINIALSSDDISNDYANDVLQRLALIKPLRGSMKRYFSKVNKTIETIKNFHDEQEWRYIPRPGNLNMINENNSFDINPIIANAELLNLYSEPSVRFIDKQSSLLEDEQNRIIWTEFNYSDIRYLIVTDNQARLEIVDYII